MNRCTQYIITKYTTMKIYEIISEDQQVDEILGVIPGVARAASAASGAYKAYQRGKALKTANAARKARQSTNIFGLGKYSLKGLKGKERLAMIAKRANAGNAAARGTATVKSFPSQLLTVFSWLGISYYIYDYWTQITAVEDDLAAFAAAIKSNSPVAEDNMFKGFESEQAAIAEATAIREELLGKTILSILAVSGFAGALVKNFGKIVGMLPMLGIPGKLISVLGSFVQKTGPLRGAAMLAWFETASGKEFLKEWAFALILLGKGFSTAMTLGTGLVDAAEKWLEAKTGVDIPGIPDAARSKIGPNAAQTSADYEKEVAGRKFIGSVQATDTQGYLRTDRDFYTNPLIINAVGRALYNKKPNPLDEIPKKPGAKYPTFTPALDRFSW
jgi:hypothetical protein